MTPARTPTAEQAAIITAFGTGRNLVIEAGAGTGKTSTLKMLAADAPRRRGLYVAYNRAIADDAKKDFPASVKCSTAHALAFGAVGRAYAHRLKGPRVPARETARILGINEPLRLGERILAPAQVARLVMEGADRFCRSADPEPGPYCVPKKPGLDSPEDMRDLRQILPPLVRKAWADLCGKEGRLRFSHDVYLKIYQLSGPQLTADYILFDEAQDANAVTLSIVTAQEDAQLVAVGDRSQSIYSWRGAVDAMDSFPDAQRLALSQSFRFGSAVAREANKWLAILGAQLRLTGYGRISSMLAELQNPDAILCRTNAQAVSQAMAAVSGGKQAAIVGGGNEIRRLAEAAITLKAGAGTDHPELMAFRTWGEVQDHAENDPGGSDLKVLVNLIDKHGPDAIIAVVDGLADERRAEVVISTAHKAKGREWNSVKIAPDFREPKKQEDGTPGVIQREEAMLSYVAVTRARLTLDRSGLAWVDRYLPGGAG
jgi:hypothetical protein